MMYRALTRKRRMTRSSKGIYCLVLTHSFPFVQESYLLHCPLHSSQVLLKQKEMNIVKRSETQRRRLTGGWVLKVRRDRLLIHCPSPPYSLLLLLTYFTHPSFALAPAIQGVVLSVRDQSNRSVKTGLGGWC